MAISGAGNQRKTDEIPWVGSGRASGFAGVAGRKKRRWYVRLFPVRKAPACERKTDAATPHHEAADALNLKVSFKITDILV